MADNVIKVSVTSTKSQRVSVSSSQVATNITANSDTGRFWSQTSKNWAVSENIVDNEDYSSKYYANKSKESANTAKGYLESTREIHNSFASNASSYINELTGLKDAGIQEINSAKTTIINDIEFVADGEKKEIEDLIDNGKEELKESIGDVKVLTTLEIGDIGFTQMAIDETKGKRRVLNGQLIIQEQYIQFTNIIKNSVAFNPDLACTEEEWQTEVTMNTFGLCGKFVIDDEGGTIRLPKYPNYFIAGLANIAPVVGNGMTLGLTTGARNFGLMETYNQSVNNVFANEGAFGVNVGTFSPLAWNNETNQGLGVTTDSTKSGIEAQINEKQIAGTYFIQVATGAETEDNIINEIELNNPFSLLDYKFSEYELNNLSWLRSNGQYNSKAVYPAVYELLLKIYNGTETKAGVSVKLHTEEYTDYDFVLNTAEETFRLPILTKDRVVVETKTVAPTTENDSAISYTYTLYNDGWLEYNGRFSLTGPSTVILPIPFANTNYNVQVTDGGSARIAYGYEIYNASTFKIVGTAVNNIGSWYACGYAEIPTENNNLYFYVGETVQNANLINAGRIEEKLVGKLDRSAVKAYIVETYVNGTSWYRIWSDGWIEQGGYTSGGNTTITLLKPYTNANYTVLVTMHAGGTPLSTNGYRNKTRKDFYLWGRSYSANDGYSGNAWYTCGY